jgi:hypothetical protein
MMRSKAFTLMLGTLTMILAAACTSTEKGGSPVSTGHGAKAKDGGAVSSDRSVRDAKLQTVEPHSPAKQPSPSPAPQIDRKGQHESPSSSAGHQTRDAVPPADQREAAITPLDQSEAPNDLETTRRIRQAVMQDGSLSFRAKNVTIVTNGDRVVLTGPVNTRAEADRIKGIAQSITPYRIEDRLEIR